VMPLRSKLLGELSHGGKKTKDFLDMVASIIRLAANFHHHIADGLVDSLKPAMLMVQLVP